MTSQPLMNIEEKIRDEVDIDYSGQPISAESIEAIVENRLANYAFDHPWCFVCDRPMDDCGCVENGGNY